MSETPELAADATDGAHRYNGSIGIGDPHERSRLVETAVMPAEMTDAEREHNRRMFGVTYRERTGQTVHDQRRAHAKCVSYCLAPGQRTRGTRCPACFGPVEIRAIEQEDIDPCPTHAERLAAWIGGWAGAFWDAMMFPFRVGRAHTEAMIRDILRDASMEIDALDDILQVLSGIEETLLAIRNAADAVKAGEK